MTYTDLLVALFSAYAIGFASGLLLAYTLKVFRNLGRE